MEIIKIDRDQNIVTIGNKKIQLDCNFWEFDFDNKKEVRKLYAFLSTDICISYKKILC